MKHAIIGTAGHVDHGKTCLIKALTGIDTDRLQEEKRRGITIELGFAHLEFPDGTQAGIVDVPGHEKFIRNMLAGAGGVDIAMLVVAADEGFMPQTVEHLDILCLLGIRQGLVVITKADLADAAWLKMISQDIRQRVKGTFLEVAPILPVSAHTGQGMDELRQLLQEQVQQAEARDTRTPFRLPIDRVFSVDGFGTVVTGTLVEGCIRENDPVQLMPGGVMTRARSVQVYGKKVSAAYAGQRVAVNLAGLKKSEVQRGDLAAKPDTVQAACMLDVLLKNLPNSPRVIENGSRVHLHLGSRTMLARVILLDAHRLQPGQEAYAQLRLSEQVSTKIGDRFVIRFYSPLETLGGGVILHNAPEKHRRFDRQVLQSLQIRQSGSESQRICQTLREFSLQLPDAQALADEMNIELSRISSALQELAACGRVVSVFPGRYLSAEVLEEIWGRCRELLEAYHRNNPLHGGMKLPELRQKLLGNAEPMAADAVLTALEAEGKLRCTGDRCALYDFSVQLTKKQRVIREKLLKVYQQAGVRAPAPEDVYAMFAPGKRGDVRQVLECLVSGGGLVLLTKQVIWHASVYEEVCRILRDWFCRHETLTLAEFRDLLGTSRQYALWVLEYFDKIKKTQKQGDLRRRGSVPL